VIDPDPDPLDVLGVAFVLGLCVLTVAAIVALLSWLGNSTDPHVLLALAAALTAGLWVTTLPDSD
jgi:hypothetical protein